MTYFKGILRWCVAVCLLAAGVHGHAQCIFAFDQEIRDNSQVDLEMDISGLNFNDLSTNQGLCAIRLEFNHEYLGDLTVELVSPSGQVITLVGPQTDQINPTNLTSWNVIFTACGSPAIPDAGFSANWSNNQPWGVFGSYSGTYYPNSGCLEDFNTGSANGTWTLRLRDDETDASGNLVSAELVFCDNSGLSCSLCAADAGEFAATSVHYCEPSDVDPALFEEEYPDPGDRPSADDYGFIYTISPNGGNVVIVDQPGAFAWQRTSYTVCGISFLKTDSVQLRNQIDTMNQLELQSAFVSGQIAACSEISAECIELTIENVIDTTRLNEMICEGQSFTVGGSMFDQPGEYIVPLSSSFGCDSIVKLNLEVEIVRPRIEQTDTLTCELQSTTLSALASTVGGTPEYSWSTANGIITGASNLPEVTINAPGMYMLELTSMPSGCSERRTIEVVTDNSVPFVAVEDYIVDCRITSVTAEALAFRDDLELLWLGPNGFSSTDENPVLSDTGDYSLRVEDPENGCRNVTTFRVNGDLSPPNFNLGTRKRCDNARYTLFMAPFNFEEYRWEGPGGFTANAFSVFAPSAGQYFGYVTGPNGCVGVDSVTIDDDFDIPDIDILTSVDSLNCNGLAILNAQSSQPGTDFSWSGPGLQLSGTDSITTGVPGVYIATGEAPNGCSGVDTIEIFAGDGRPDILAFGDTLTCDKDTALIGVVPAVGVTRYEWTGPAVVDSGLAFVRVTQPGAYTVEVTDVLGCRSVVSILVERDFRRPTFAIASDTLTCAGPNASLWFVPTTDYRSLIWTSPAGATFSDSAIIVSQAGNYTLEVTGLNGCSRVSVHEVPIDTLPPTLFIESVSFGCIDSLQLRTLSFDSTYSYIWSGPGGFNDTLPEPYIFAPGEYQVIVTGTNGCQRTRSTTVVDDTDAPRFAVSAELLDCIDSSAVLSVTSPDTAATFTWSSSSETLSDSAAVTVTEAADYFLSVRGGNQCIALDTVNVAPPVIPVITSSLDTLNCRDTEVELIARSDSSGMMYEWFDATGSPLATGATYVTSLPGQYSIIGTWINGCTSDTATTVEIDTIRPMAIVETSGVVRCDSRQLFLSGVMSVGDSLDFSWSTADGDIVFGELSDSVFVRDAGTYVLEVTEVSNFCTDSYAFEVAEQPNSLESFSLAVVPECQGNGAGEIRVLEVVGSDSRLQYSLGGDFQFETVFDSLILGEYKLTAIDSFGCIIDTSVNVSETSSEVTVNLGPDVRALLGDEVLLEADILSDVSEIFWSPTQPCDSCGSNVVTPLETQAYTVFIRDLFGCLAQDDIVVYIAERAQVYVPNIFTPNGDGENDLHMPSFHPGVARVDHYAIYDRWGNLVFGADNVPPDPSQMTWDGTLDGDELHAAVFTWIMNVELLTGRRETLTGDITLLR